MKKMTLLLSAAMFVCSAALSFAADSVKKLAPKKNPAQTSQAAKDEAIQSGPTIRKDNKAHGDPHVNEAAAKDKRRAR